MELTSRRVYSHGQNVALECATEFESQGRQDVPALEDTVDPVEVQDTKIEVILVENRLLVLPRKKKNPVRNQCPKIKYTPPEAADDEEANH